MYNAHTVNMYTEDVHEHVHVRTCAMEIDMGININIKFNNNVNMKINNFIATARNSLFITEKTTEFRGIHQFSFFLSLTEYESYASIIMITGKHLPL